MALEAEGLSTSSAVSLSSSLSDTAILIRTVDFAARKHQYQRRKDTTQTPYINHPIGVARILIDEGDVEEVVVVQAALLHDTVEDTETTLAELEQHFGQKVASIVDEVTDDKLKPKEERKALQISTGPSKSREAKLVKMADKIYNLRDLKRCLPVGWDEDRRNEYFLWAEKVVINCYEANDKLATVLRTMFKQRLHIETA